MKQLNERMRKRPIYDCIFDKYDGFHVSEEEIVEVAQLEEDLAKHEGQIRHYPDTYLGKIFFQGVEQGRKQLEEDLEEYKEGIEVERYWKQEAYDRNTELKRELQKSMDREYALDNNERALKRENEVLRRKGMFYKMDDNKCKVICRICKAWGWESDYDDVSVSFPHKKDCALLTAGEQE